MSLGDGTQSVNYRSLVTDSALISVFLASGVVALGINAVPVALPGIGAAFSLSESEIGLVMSVFSVAGLVMMPISSVLADVYGRRAIIIPSLLLLGVSGVATLAATKFWMLLALRAVQGAAFAGTLPLTPTLIGDLYVDAEGSAAQGIRTGVNGLAGTIAPLVAGGLTVIAWQYPFALFAVIFPTIAIVYWWYPESVTSRRTGADGRSLRTELVSYWDSIKAVADERFGVLAVGGFVLFFLKSGFKTFLPVYVVTGLGGSVTTAGTLLGLYGGMRVVFAPLTGSIVARVGRKPTIVSAIGLAAVGVGAIPFASSPWYLGLATACYAIGEAVMNPVITDAVASITTNEQRAGILSGLQILKQVAITVAPVFLGVLIVSSGFSVTFIGVAVLGVVYGLLLLLRY